MKKLLPLLLLCMFFEMNDAKAQFTDLYWPMGRNSAMGFRTNPVSINQINTTKFAINQFN